MIDWHFSRTELSEQFLDTLELGSTSTLTLFAPRRMGKTEFLLEDLIPDAGRRGYRAIYVSFWKYEDDPVRCLLDGLDATPLQRNWRSALQKVKEFLPEELSAGVTGAVQLGAKWPRRGVAQSDLENLNQRFNALLSKEEKILLCLDEVQHLATDTRFQPLVSFLRTLIDTNKERLKVILTGSSRAGLQQLFSRRKAPLFNSSSQIDLPELGSPFVRHILGAFEQATGRQLDVDESMHAFRTLNKVPYAFRAVVDIMIRRGTADILATAAEYQAHALADAGYESTWSALKPIERAILVHLARSPRGPYQDESRTFIGDYLGLDEPVAVHTIQNAINRLRGNIIASGAQGSWDFEDAQFREWILESILSSRDEA